jgi:aspartyl-tRNA(Asn)/glutamyl-tRNA(Gln) amidotransferase subunit B
MRTKEDAADYRYFPDPDLPPLVIADEWVARVRSEMTELPRVMAARFVADFGLSEYDATQLTQSKAVAAYFEITAKASGQAKLAANWVMGEVSRRLNAQNIGIDSAPVSASTLAALITRIDDGAISSNAAKQVFDHLWTPKEGEWIFGSLPGEVDAGLSALSELKRVDAIIEAKGLKQMSDTGELEAIIDTVLASNAKSVEEYKAGNAKAFNALVGQAMKATKGKGNPAQVNELLKKKLG